jgi:hypothetical protein
VESESLDGDGAVRDPKTLERPRPTTTVVVAWSGSMSELEQALGGLIPRCCAGDAELIVIGTRSAADRRRLGRLCPQARVLDAPARLSHKQLREMGAGAARGDIVILLDDERPAPSRFERQLPMSPIPDDGDEAQHSAAGVDRWLEVDGVFASLRSEGETATPRQRTAVVNWRNVAALLAELTPFRLLRTSRPARS